MEKEETPQDAELPKLPEIPEKRTPNNPLEGPIPTSNWVIPGRVIAGAYPGSLHEPQHSETIEAVISAGTLPFYH